MAAKKTDKNDKIIEVKNEDKKIDYQKIDEYIKESVDSEVKKAMEASTKKLVHHKNIVILKRDILIVILLLFYVLLCYNLYSTNYFARFFKNNNTQESSESKKESESQSVESIESVSKEELIDKYGHLLDNIKLDAQSAYVENFYSDKFDNKLKLYLAANTLDESDVSCEDDSCVIEEDDLKDKFSELFKDNFMPESFDYNGFNCRYLKSNNIFIYTKKDVNQDNKIVRVIDDVKVNDDNIEISTIEGIVKKDKLYNVATDKEVTNYKDDNTLKKNKSKLTQMKYTFDDDNYLDKIEVL